MRILSGIVAFHPDLDRLRENISAICHQVDETVVFDNGSTGLAEAFPEMTILGDDGRNLGIATALNRLCNYGKENGYDWILTLDQDSVVPTGFVEGFLPYIADERVAILCPAIRDRNYGSMAYDIGPSNSVDEVDACITSGSLLRISAWESIKGFWEDLFIDLVDFDYCWSLKEAGYRILRVNDLVLYHEIGRAKKVMLLGKENVVYNHPPLRCYYMVRNTIAVGKKHHREKQCFRWNLKRILLINLFEKDRWNKDKMILKGIRDGFRFTIR